MMMSHMMMSGHHIMAFCSFQRDFLVRDIISRRQCVHARNNIARYGELKKPKVRRMDRLRHFPVGKFLVLSETGPAEQKTQHPGPSKEPPSFFRLLFRYGASDGSGSRTLNFLRRSEDSWVDTVARIQSKVQGTKGKSAQNSASELVPVVSWRLRSKTVGVDFTVLDAFGDREATGVTVGDTFYDVVYDPPHVDMLKIDLALISDCPVIPKIDLRNSELLDIRYFWFVQSDSAVLPQLRLSPEPDVPVSVDGFEFRSSGFAFLPSPFDVGKQICVVSYPGPCSEVRAYLCEKSKIEPPEDEFIWIHRQELMRKLEPIDSIRIVSYNILADLYLNLKADQTALWFPYCSVEHQRAEYRYPLLLKELVGYEADIICLQEVDLRFFKRYLKHYLKWHGFSGLMTLKGGEVNEGLATFFSARKFRLIKSADVLIADLLNVAEHPGNGDILETARQMPEFEALLVSRPTVLQVSSLMDIESGNVVIVANTHLYFHPRDPHLRLLQAALCLRHIEAEMHANQGSGLIFCGDFNSLPESGVVEFLGNGKLNSSHTDWLAGQREETGGFHGMNLDTKLKLRNPCDTGYTNYTLHSDGKGFAGCLDYIWVDSQNFTVQRTIPTPEHALVTKYVAIPSRICPSDHLPIICDISYAVSDR